MEQFLEPLLAPTLYADTDAGRADRTRLMKQFMTICRNDLVINDAQMESYSNPNNNTTPLEGTGTPLLFSEAKDGAFSIIASLMEVYAGLDDIEAMIRENGGNLSGAEGDDENDNDDADAMAAITGADDEDAMMQQMLAMMDGGSGGDDSVNKKDQSVDDDAAKKKKQRRLWWGYKMVLQLAKQQQQQQQQQQKKKDGDDDASSSTSFSPLCMASGVAAKDAITNMKANFFVFFADIITVFSQHATVPAVVVSPASTSNNATKKRRAEKKGSNNTNNNNSATPPPPPRVQVSLLDAGGLLAIYEFITMKLLEMDDPIAAAITDAAATAAAAALATTTTSSSSDAQKNSNNATDPNNSNKNVVSTVAANAAALQALFASNNSINSDDAVARESIELIVRFRGLVLMARALLIATTLNYGHSLSAVGVTALPLAKGGAASTNAENAATSATANTAEATNEMLRKALEIRDQKHRQLLGADDASSPFAEVEDPETIAALFTAADDVRRRFISTYRKATNGASGAHLVTLQEELLVLLAGIEADEKAQKKQQEEKEEEAKRIAAAAAAEEEGDNTNADEEEEASKRKKKAASSATVTSGNVTAIHAAKKEALRRSLVARLVHYRLYMTAIHDVGSLVLTDMLHILVAKNSISVVSSHNDDDNVLEEDSIENEEQYSHTMDALEVIVAPRLLLADSGTDDEKASFEASLVSMEGCRYLRPILHFGGSASSPEYLCSIESNNTTSNNASTAITFGLHPVAGFIIDSLTRNINDSLRLFNDIAVESARNTPANIHTALITAIEAEELLVTDPNGDEEDDGDDYGTVANKARRDNEKAKDALETSLAFFTEQVPAAELYQVFSFAMTPMASSALPAVTALAYIVRPNTNHNNNAAAAFALRTPLRMAVAARFVALSTKSVAALHYIFNDADVGMGHGHAALIQQLAVDTAVKVGAAMLEEGSSTSSSSLPITPTLANASVATSGLDHRSFILVPSVFWSVAVHSVITFSLAWLLETHALLPTFAQTAGRRKQLCDALFKATEALRVDKMLMNGQFAAADVAAAGNNNANKDNDNAIDAAETPTATAATAAIVTAATDDTDNTNTADTAAALPAALQKSLGATLTAALAAKKSKNSLVALANSAFLYYSPHDGDDDNNAAVADATSSAASVAVCASYVTLPAVGLWLAAGVTPSSAAGASVTAAGALSLPEALTQLMANSLSALLQQSYEESTTHAVYAAEIAAAKAPRAHIYRTSAGKMTIDAIVDSIILSLQDLKVQRSALFVDYAAAPKRLQLKKVAASGLPIGASASDALEEGEGTGAGTGAAHNTTGSSSSSANNNLTKQQQALLAAKERNVIEASEDVASLEPAFERQERYRSLRTALSEHAHIHVLDTDPETPLSANLLRWVHTLGRNTAVRRAAYGAQRREIRIQGLDGGMGGGVGGGIGSDPQQQQHIPLGHMIRRLQTGMLTIQRAKDAMSNIHPRARIQQAAFGSLLRGFHRLAASGASESALRQAQSLVSRCLAHCPAAVRDRCEDMLCAYLNEAIVDVNNRQKRMSAAAAAASAGGDQFGSSSAAKSSVAAGSSADLQAYRALLSPNSQCSVLALCVQCLYTAVAQSASAKSVSMGLLEGTGNGGGGEGSTSSSSSSSYPAVTLHTSDDAGKSVDPEKPLQWITTSAAEQERGGKQYLQTAQRQHVAAVSSAADAIGSKRPRSSNNAAASSSSSSVEITMTTAQSASLFEADEMRKGNRYSVLATRILATMLALYKPSPANAAGGAAAAAAASGGIPAMVMGPNGHPIPNPSLAASFNNSSTIPAKAFYDFIDACPMITNFMWTFWHAQVCLNFERVELGMSVLCHIAQTRPAHRGRAIASLLYFSSLENRTARNAAIAKLREFMVSPTTLDYCTAEERDALVKTAVDYCLRQCDSLADAVNAVGAATPNPNFDPMVHNGGSATLRTDALSPTATVEETNAAIAADAALFAASAQPPVLLSSNTLSAKQKAKFHLLSEEKIKVLEGIMTFDYDNPSQTFNAIANHHSQRTCLLQNWTASPSTASLLQQPPITAIAPEQAYATSNNAAKDIVEQHLSLLCTICRVDGRHAVTLVKRLLELYAQCATLSKAQSLTIDAITRGGGASAGAGGSTASSSATVAHAAAAAFAAARGGAPTGTYDMQGNEILSTPTNTNLLFALQRLFLGSSVCSAILYNNEVDGVLRNLFGRVRSNFSEELTSPIALKIDFSQQELFATRLLPAVRQSPPAAADLVTKVMSTTAYGIRAFLTEISQLPFALTRENNNKLSGILTIVQNHCKFLFSSKSALGAIAPPSIAPATNPSFTTQMLGAAFGHATPISVAATMMPSSAAVATTGAGAPQQVPTVSPAVIAAVASTNKKSYDTAKATANAFNALAAESPTIPSDIRLALPILGLVDRAELREVFVPAFVRLFAATEALRVPCEAPKADFFRNLIGANQTVLNANGSKNNNAAAADLSAAAALPATYLTLLQGSAAIVDLTMQEVMWHMLVPCDVPNTLSAEEELECAEAMGDHNYQITSSTANNTILNRGNKRGLGALDFVTETMLVCNRTRRDAVTNASAAAAAAAGSSSSPAALLLSRFDHLLFGDANPVSLSCGSRLMKMLNARRTRPTFCPISPTSPCLKAPAIALLNELLLMPSTNAAASDFAFGWFDRKLGVSAAATAATAAAQLLNPNHHGHHQNPHQLHHLHLQHHQHLSNSSNSAVTPIAPIAAVMPQGLMLGGLDVFKTRLRRTSDILAAAGITPATASVGGAAGATTASAGGPVGVGGSSAVLTTTGSTGAVVVGTVNSTFVDNCVFPIEQFVQEWCKGLSARLTEAIVQSTDRNPIIAANALLLQQLYLHVAPPSVAPGIAVATIAAPTVNKLLTAVTGRSTVTATAVPSLEPLTKAVDVSTLFDRFQRIQNAVAPSEPISRFVSNFWARTPVDVLWMVYSALHIPTVSADPNYSEPLRERGVRAIADTITDLAVQTLIAAPAAAAANATTTTTAGGNNGAGNSANAAATGGAAANSSSNNPQQQLQQMVAQQPLEAQLLVSWALLYAEEHWAHVEGHLLSLPDRRLVELLVARPRLYANFVAANKHNPQYQHLLQQLQQVLGGGGVAASVAEVQQH